MKSTKYALLTGFVLSALTCSAMKYQIKVLNTPTISIDDKAAKVGDWFDDNSKITWSRDNQAMRVLSEGNHVYTLSAKLYKEAGAKKFSDFIAYTKPLAVRGAKTDDLIDQLYERFDNTFVMLDELVIDLSGIEFNKNDSFGFKWQNNSEEDDFLCKKATNNHTVIILRDEIMKNDKEQERNLSFIIRFYPINDRPATITDNFQLEIMPISQE